MTDQAGCNVPHYHECDLKNAEIDNERKEVGGGVRGGGGGRERERERETETDRDRDRQRGMERERRRQGGREYAVW